MGDDASGLRQRRRAVRPCLGRHDAIRAARRTDPEREDLAREPREAGPRVVEREARYAMGRFRRSRSRPASVVTRSFPDGFWLSLSISHMRLPPKTYGADSQMVSPAERAAPKNIAPLYGCPKKFALSVSVVERESVRSIAHDIPPRDAIDVLRVDNPVPLPYEVVDQRHSGRGVNVRDHVPIRVRRVVVARWRS